MDTGLAGITKYHLRKRGEPSQGFPRGQWCAVWFENGKRHQRRLAIGLEQSEAVARSEFNSFVQKRNLLLFSEKKNIPKISEIMKVYFEDRELEGKNVKGMKTQWLANMEHVFGPLKPSHLMAAMDVRGEQRTICHKYAIDRQDQKASRATIYYELNILRSGMNWAAAKGRNLIDPVIVWLPRNSRPRDSQLTFDEIYSIYTECSKWHHLKLFMLLAMTTTQRKAAILELKWSQVDFKKRQIDFRLNRDGDDILDTGGKKGRSVVDMRNLLYRELQQAKLYAQTDYVIEYNGAPIKDIKKSLKAAIGKAGIKKKFAGAHAIRKSVAGLLADDGVEMRRIQKLLGHSDISTTDRIYAHHSPGYLTGAIDLIEEIVTSRAVVTEGVIEVQKTEVDILE